MRGPGNNKGKLNALQIAGSNPSQLTSGIGLGELSCRPAPSFPLRAGDGLLAFLCPLPCQIFQRHLRNVLYTGDVTELR